jgi:hypothetical protein
VARELQDLRRAAHAWVLLQVPSVPTRKARQLSWSSGESRSDWLVARCLTVNLHARKLARLILSNAWTKLRLLPTGRRCLELGSPLREEPFFPEERYRPRTDVIRGVFEEGFMAVSQASPYLGLAIITVGSPRMTAAWESRAASFK